MAIAAGSKHLIGEDSQQMFQIQLTYALFESHNMSKQFYSNYTCTHFS